MSEPLHPKPLRIVGIAGSPTRPSRSTALLRVGLTQAGSIEHAALQVSEIEVRELPAQALLSAQFDQPELVEAMARVLAADLVLVATPIYKAAYSGVLKAFLDLLPQDGLRGKTVLPLATGGSIGHLLALDYALKPVLSALGARHILDAVYADDSQFTRDEHLGYLPQPAVLSRVERALQPWHALTALSLSPGRDERLQASC